MPSWLANEFFRFLLPPLAAPLAVSPTPIKLPPSSCLLSPISPGPALLPGLTLSPIRREHRPFKSWTPRELPSTPVLCGRQKEITHGIFEVKQIQVGIPHSGTQTHPLGTGHFSLTGMDMVQRRRWSLTGALFTPELSFPPWTI